MPPQSGASAHSDNKSPSIPVITGNENIPDVALVPELPDTPPDKTTRSDQPEAVETRGGEISEKIMEEKIPEGLTPLVRTPGVTVPKIETPVQTVPPSAQSPASPVIPKKTEPENKTRIIRTYQTDVAESVRTNKTSLARMVIAEHERGRELAEIESPRSKRNILFISLSLVFLLVGTITAVIFFNKSRQPQTTIDTERAPSIIFAENERPLSVTGISTETLAAMIGKEVSGANNKLDTIENIAFSENESGIALPLTTQRLFFFLDNRMPPSLIRSLDKKFMFGIHTFNGNRPFLIFRTEFYENTFAGMLGWEQYMARDLFPVFAIKKDPTNLIFNKPFEDRVIKNMDARVLRDGNGDIILFYAFKDKKTLIITNSEHTLEEVIKRLNASSQVTR